MREIDITTWNRRSHYEWFSSFANPCFDINLRLDVSGLLKYCKNNNVSSFAAITYLIAKSMNSFEKFRCRINDGKVYIVDNANVCYTAIAENDDFVNCRIMTDCGFPEFHTNIRHQIDEVKSNHPVQKQFNDTTVINDIYCSCLPWLDFVSVTQPIPDNRPESNSIPRVCWGRYVTENDKTTVAFNFTFNHALVDGRDAAELINKLQSMFNMPDSFLQ